MVSYNINYVPWCSISQWCQEDEHREVWNHKHSRGDDSFDSNIRNCSLYPSHARTRPRDRIVDRFTGDEVEDGSSHQSRAQMSWQVMVKEQLAVHEEEGEVVEGPGNEEETRRVPQAVTDNYREIR
jgi:hypothetical protein